MTKCIRSTPEPSWLVSVEAVVDGVLLHVEQLGRYEGLSVSVMLSRDDARHVAELLKEHADCEPA